MATAIDDQTTAQNSPDARHQHGKHMTWQRAAGRSFIAITIFTCAIAGLATLMHAGIDPDVEALQTEGTLLNTLTRMADRF